MVRVTAPSRLHFGLFALPAADSTPLRWPDLDGQPSLPARAFGGVGLMVASPSLSLRVPPAEPAGLGAVTLARLVGRCRRSARGVHGFALGGLLVEGGKRSADAKPSVDAVAPLVARMPFPVEWRVLLVIPRDLQGCHGPRETEAFQRLGEGAHDLRRTEALCRLVLLGMLPALAEHDLDTFGEALHDFNRHVGE